MGKTILLNRVPFAIIGVTEKQFDSLTPGRPIDLWIPLAIAPRIEAFWSNENLDASYWWLVVVGRLKSGETREAAAAQLRHSSRMKLTTARTAMLGGRCSSRKTGGPSS